METSVKITPKSAKIDIPSMPCNMNTTSSIAEEAWGHGWENSPTTRWDNQSENENRAIGSKRYRRSTSDHSSSHRRYNHICRESESPTTFNPNSVLQYTHYHDRSSSFDHSRRISRRYIDETDPPSTSSDALILSELLDLSKTVTTLNSRIIELEKSQEAMRLIILGGPTSSSSRDDNENRENIHREARIECEMAKKKQKDSKKRGRDI